VIHSARRENLSGDTIKEAGETRFRQDGPSTILFDPATAEEAQPRWFDIEWWKAQGLASPASAGRGPTWFVGPQGAEWVLRHCHRGGALGRWIADHYLWLGLERARPFVELRFTQRLLAIGLPVPRPVAARVVRAGFVYTGDLITERITGARPVSALLGASPMPVTAWRAIGRCIRRFHDLGVYHADLTANNILIDGGERISIIDFDRGGLRAPGAWRAANLSRLKRSLTKICGDLPRDRFGPADWAALQQAYEAGVPVR
jgi:3-deoxy-D-manno-octulosonic acid kinase